MEFRFMLNLVDQHLVRDATHYHDEQKEYGRRDWIN
jgi:hypothetical protein